MPMLAGAPMPNKSRTADSAPRRGVGGIGNEPIGISTYANSDAPRRPAGRKKNGPRRCQFVTPGTNARCWSDVKHSEPGEAVNRFCGRHEGYMRARMRADGYLQPLPAARAGDMNLEPG
jgi:hypothetical protein